MKGRMKIGIFGLGYVGTVTAACLAQKGHIVTGVDVNEAKVAAINKGNSPVLEKDMDNIVASTVKSGRFYATTSPEKVVLETDMAMVCVGTPAKKSGSIDISHLKKATRQIAKALRMRKNFYTIVIRSTVLPGTTEEIVIPILERYSKKKIDRDFGVCINPEFMREGNSVEDFYRPAKTIIGIRTEKEKVLMTKVLGFIKAPLITTSVRTAEFCKYLDNTFHALKICFANEMALIGDRLGVEADKAIEVFCMDKISNISNRYLNPGFAFGGSCLPKDIKAVLYKARIEDLCMPLVGSILVSNDAHIKRAFRAIVDTGKKKVSLLGLSFKPGTDDLRESQLVKLSELLINKGFKVKIYDKNISLAHIVGTNKAYIREEMPHISSLLCHSLDEALQYSEVIVVGHNIKEFRGVKKKIRKDQIFIDLT